MNSEERAGGFPAPPQLCEYAADVTAERLNRMLSHVDGVRKGDDPVHLFPFRAIGGEMGI